MCKQMKNWASTMAVTALLIGPSFAADEVVKVKGLGPAWYAKVKGNLTTGGAVPAPTQAAAPGKK